MISFHEILCSIDSFLNSKQKETVASEFKITRFGLISIIIHEIFSDYIDGNGKICELHYLNGRWNIEWERHCTKISDYIEYVVSIMNGEIKDCFEYDIENYNWQP
jgi:hypothetical protein